MNGERLKMIFLLLEDIPRDERNRLVNEVNNQCSYQADKVGLVSDNCQRIANNCKHYGF